MIKQWGLLTLTCGFLLGCSGWSSELNTVNVTDQNKALAPVCTFNLQDNCYTRSMELLQSCVQPVVAGDEWMSDQLDDCRNSTGKSIRFEKSLGTIGDFESDVSEFKVRNGQKTCFRFRGTKGNFIIDQNDFGVLQVSLLGNGDTQVSCFFNQGFEIPASAKQRGCRGEKALVTDFLPSIQWNVSTRKKETGEVVYDRFEFLFLGTGVPSEPLFSCQL